MTTFNLELENLWLEVKSLIKKEAYFDDTIYETYFHKTRLKNLDGNTAVVSVESFFQQMILSGEASVISRTLGNILNIDGMDCEIILESGPTDLERFKPQPVVQPVITDDGIMSTHTFKNFVVGTSNRESHAAAVGAAHKPGQYFTPLFIYGNSGLGKTHLLHSIGNFIKEKNADAKVLYISSSDFVKYVAKSIQNGVIEDFKDQMNNLDVLLIDDIQFIAGKEKSHEIFFHIFNELVNNRKQIVITSDRLPTDIKGLEDRLISRFSSGLSVGVDTPEFETALAILYMKIRNQSMDEDSFSEEALTYIATNFSKDVRQLEGALNRLLFFSINAQETGAISLNTAMDAFKGDHQPPTEVDPKSIKKVVADYYGLTVTQLTGKSRTKPIANARHIAIFLTRKHLDLSYSKIGEEYGRRDHSTIISACDKIENGIKINELLASAIKELEAKLSI